MWSHGMWSKAMWNHGMWSNAMWNARVSTMIRTITVQPGQPQSLASRLGMLPAARIGTGRAAMCNTAATAATAAGVGIAANSF